MLPNLLRQAERQHLRCVSRDNSVGKLLSNQSRWTLSEALLKLIEHCQGFDGSILTLDQMLGAQWFKNLDKDDLGGVNREEFTAFIQEYTNIEQTTSDKIFDHIIDANIIFRGRREHHTQRRSCSRQ